MARSQTDKWRQYEAEKARIARQNLSPEEYQRLIRQLAISLGV